jgi:hypothetical protein
LLVLVLVLDLGLDALEDTDGSREVVNTAGSLQGGAEDLNGGNEIVSEAVVQVALELEDILNTLKFLLKSIVMTYSQLNWSQLRLSHRRDKTRAAPNSANPRAASPSSGMCRGQWVV